MKAIAIDNDGVIFKFVEGFLPFYNIRTGLNLTYNDIKYYGIEKCSNPEITSEEFKEILLDFADQDGYKNLEIYPYAKETLRQLSSKYLLHTVTARPISRIDPNKVKEQTELCCLRHFGDIFDEFHFISHHEKPVFYNKNGYTLVIEDSLENVLETKFPALLFDHPWNQFDGDLPVRIKRIKPRIKGSYLYWLYILESWGEIEKELNL